ncbi:MAG: hypothetical protein WD941_04620 [Opitutus sp.]
MKPYLDTNFLLRVFLDYEETDSALAGFRAMRAKGGCPTTWLHRIEYANALHLMVFQTRSGGLPRVTPQIAAIAQADFDAALSNGEGLEEASLAGTELATLCREISGRQTTRHGFRTYDIIHVASARLLGCDAFWSFDAKANKLASLEGLKTL